MGLVWDFFFWTGFFLICEGLPDPEECLGKKICFYSPCTIKYMKGRTSTYSLLMLLLIEIWILSFCLYALSNRERF